MGAAASISATSIGLIGSVRCADVAGSETRISNRRIVIPMLSYKCIHVCKCVGKQTYFMRGKQSVLAASRRRQT